MPDSPSDRILQRALTSLRGPPFPTARATATLAKMVAGLKPRSGMRAFDERRPVLPPRPEPAWSHQWVELMQLSSSRKRSPAPTSFPKQCGKTPPRSPPPSSTDQKSASARCNRSRGSPSSTAAHHWPPKPLHRSPPDYLVPGSKNPPSPAAPSPAAATPPTPPAERHLDPRRRQTRQPRRQPTGPAELPQVIPGTRIGGTRPRRVRRRHDPASPPPKNRRTTSRPRAASSRRPSHAPNGHRRWRMAAPAAARRRPPSATRRTRRPSCAATGEDESTL